MTTHPANSTETHQEELPQGSEWNRYRIMQRVLRITIVPSVVWMLIAKEAPQLAQKVPTLVGFILLIPVMISWASLYYFACPRCGDGFFHKPGIFQIYRPFATACIHCGFPKWKEPDPSSRPKRGTNPYPIPREIKPWQDPAIAERARLVGFLTLVLRDDPGAIGLKSDAFGWTNLELLVSRAERAGVPVPRGVLKDLLADPEEPHFVLDPDGTHIRFVS